MEEYKYCKLCLVTDVKMFNINTPSCLSLFQTYSELVQFVCEDYQVYACYECASLLRKCQEFRNKCLTALSVLSSIHIDLSKITKENVQNMDRKLYNLDSKLARFPTMLCNSTDQHDLPKDCFITHQKLFWKDEMKTELDMELQRPKIELDIDAPMSDKNSHEENTDILEITAEPFDCMPEDDDDYIPEVKKKRKPATNLKKRKLKSTKIKKERKNTSSLAKRSLKTTRIEYNLNKDTSKKEVSGPIQSKGPKFNASCFKDYATVELLTPEDVKKELLLRKESSTYKISPYKCEFCYRGYELKPAFDNHMKKHDKEYGSWECEYCHLRFTTRISWTFHHKSCHKYKFICKICPYVCYYNYQAKTHMSFHKGKKYTCNECGMDFSFPNTLIMHKRVKHHAEFPCALCGSMLASQRGLSIHIVMIHKQENNEAQGPKCAECDVQFATETAWKRHLVLSSKHTVSNGCEDCGETFSDEKDLKIHMKVHSRKWRNSKFCNICDKWLKSRGEYKNHMTENHPQSDVAKKITIEKQIQFVCEECGMAFTKKCLLHNHQRIHSSERPYQCRECGKTFKVPKLLYQHENIHTRKRVFQCDFCQKEYNTKSALIKHIKANHLGIRPHKCSYCDKSFLHKYEMRTHVKYVHYKEPWPKRDRTKRTTY